MLDSECKIGAFVICNSSLFFGNIGYIKIVFRDLLGDVESYVVADMLHNPIGNPWTDLSYWSLYNTSAPVETLQVLSKECPCGINRKDCIYHA